MPGFDPNFNPDFNPDARTPEAKPAFNADFNPDFNPDAGGSPEPGIGIDHPIPVNPYRKNVQANPDPEAQKSAGTSVLASINKGIIRPAQEIVGAGLGVVEAAGLTLNDLVSPLVGTTTVDEAGRRAWNRWTKPVSKETLPASADFMERQHQTDEYFSESIKKPKAITRPDGSTDWAALNPVENPWLYTNIVAENAPMLAVQMATGWRAYNSAILAGKSPEVAARVAAATSAKLEGTQIGADAYQSALEKGLGPAEAALAASAEAIPATFISQGLPGGKGLLAKLEAKGATGLKRKLAEIAAEGTEGVFFKGAAKAAAKGGASGRAARLALGGITEAIEETGQGEVGMAVRRTYDPEAYKNANGERITNALGGLLLGAPMGAMVGPGATVESEHVENLRKVAEQTAQVAEQHPLVESAQQDAQEAQALLSEAQADLGAGSAALQPQAPPAPDMAPQAPEAVVQESFTPDPTVKESLTVPGDPRHESLPVEVDQRQGDRRQDPAFRKNVAEMSLEETQRVLLTSEKTGLPNRRAWDEAQKSAPKPVKASMDVDSLKWVNDSLGHGAGDELLAYMGDALRAAGLGEDAFHVSGDEFWAHSDSEEALAGAMAKADEYLKANPVVFNLPDGSTVSYTGGFSYGAGPELNAAESKLQAHKSERERTGQRAARGDQPPSVQYSHPARPERTPEVRGGEPGSAGELSGGHDQGQVPPEPVPQAQQVEAPQPQEDPNAKADEILARMTPKDRAELDALGAELASIVAKPLNKMNPKIRAKWVEKQNQIRGRLAELRQMYEGKGNPLDVPELGFGNIQEVKEGDTFTHEGREYRMHVTDDGQVKTRDLTMRGGQPIVRSWGSIQEFESATGIRIKGTPESEAAGVNAPAPAHAKPPAESRETAEKAKAIPGVGSNHPAYPFQEFGDYVVNRALEGETLDNVRLRKRSNLFFKNQPAQKDLYDAVELGVNRHILAHPELFNVQKVDIKKVIRNLEDMVSKLPTQTHREAQANELQQYSTPPFYSAVVSWVANVRPGDVVLEPSAGVGGIAVFPRLAGARVLVNEFDRERRAKLLEALPGWESIKMEDARFINAHMKKAGTVPTVVVMNPPFSSTSGNVHGKRDSAQGVKHIESALSSMERGGRLVAIMGDMEGKAWREWRGKIESDPSLTIQALVRVDGSKYRKYGTSFDSVVLVVDRKAKPAGHTPVTGPVDDLGRPGLVASLEELADILEGVRNERPDANDLSTRPDGAPVEPGGPAAAEDGGAVSSQGKNPPAGGDPGGASVLDSSGKPGVSSAPAAGPVRGGRNPHTVRGGAAPIHGAAGVEPEGSGGLGAGIVRPDQPGGIHPVESVSGSGEVQKPSGAPERAGRPGSEDVRTDDVAPVKVEAGKDTAKVEQVEESADSIFSVYRPSKVTFPGSKTHPGELVESQAMAAVDLPDAKASTKIHIPEEVIKSGKLSDAQLEAIFYATQATDTLMDDGKRQGFLIGDGTGVGKGREISGIIMSSLNAGQGSGKAIWLSKNSDLFKDATRDWTGIGGDGGSLFDLSKFKATQGDKGAKSVAPLPIDKGILFGTYATVTGTKGEVPGARKEQLKAWLGEDFDGVIVLDEAHLASNLGMGRGTRGRPKPSETALGMREIQDMFPKARVVYVTATVASDPAQLGFLDRLGLWGKGKAFVKASDLVGAVQSAGLAGMELVARDLKARGLYIARNLSYHGVNYRTLEHPLSTEQTEAYDIAAGAWQKVLENVNQVIEAMTDGHNSGKLKGAALSKFYGQQQAFFNSLLTSLTLPSAFEDMQKQVEAGNSVVIQLTETGEARQNRAINEAATRAMESGEEMDVASIDLSPKDILIGFLKSGFPVNAVKEVADEEGHTRWEVVRDSQGNPVQDPEAVAKRDDLISEIATLRLPGSALDEILKEFGTDNVAEITGRSERRVYLPDGTAKIEKRTDKQVDGDKNGFMAGKKKILVFSKAANTGMSFHADNAAQNRTKRIHYVLQGGWNAADAIQGLGRTHRTNQAQAPEYILVTTDLGGHKRFTSTIARRISQLGALTKGQRQASASLFTEKDNLESPTALRALSGWYDELMRGGVRLPDGSSFTEEEFSDSTGLRLRESDGTPKLERPPMRQFLNRVLALPVGQQNAVFDSLAHRIEEQYDTDERSGLLEKGLQNIPVEGAKVVEEDPFFTDPDTGAKTVYQKVEAEQKVHYYGFDKVNQGSKDFVGFYQNPNSKIPFAISKTRLEMKPDGSQVQHYKMIAPSIITYSHKVPFDKLDTLSPEDAQQAWTDYRARMGETETKPYHLITGAMLNIWNRFPTDLPMDVGRIRLSDGNIAMGRLIPESRLNDVLARIGADKALNATQKAARSMKGQDVIQSVIQNGRGVSLSNGFKIIPVRRSGEYFAVLDGPTSSTAMQGLVSHYPGWRVEQFQGQFGSTYKLVIPDTPEAKGSLDAYLKAAPVNSVSEPRPGWVKPQAGNGGIQELGGFTHPVGAFLSKLFGTRERPDSVSVPSLFDEVEQRWREAKKGAPASPMFAKAIDNLRKAKAAFTRHFDHIDPNESPLMAQVHDTLRQYEAGPAFAKAVAHDMVYEVTKDLGPKRIDLFTRVLVLRDILRNVDKGVDSGTEELPFGYRNAEEARVDLARYEKVLKAPENAPIREALGKRTDMATDIVEKLVQHGILSEDRLDDVDSYYHRQVMTYLNKRQIGTTGGDLRMKKKGFQLGRHGGAHDFNAAYEQAEAEWVADAMTLVVKKETLDRLERLADMAPQLRAQAKDLNREMFESQHPELGADEIDEMSAKEIETALGEQAVAWKDLMPEGYTIWQPTKGNHFYSALTLSERVLDQFLEGERGLEKEDFHQVLALGTKKKQWAIPENLATQLDNFTDRDGSAFGNAWVGLQSTWKQWQLISPMRILRYSMNNMMGDLDIAMAYDPRIVTRHFLRAAGDMWSYQVSQTASPELRREIQNAIRAGVVESGITIAEIPDIDKAGAFRLLTSDRPSGNLVQKAWGGLKTFSTWRENILRLAAYRFFLDEIGKGRDLYAASNRGQIDALGSSKDKAAKLARELIGDYGNVSVAGQNIRTHLIPFYSWMEVNAPRYVRLLKNLPAEREATGEKRSAAGAVGRTIALKGPAMALRMALMFGLIYLWNKLFFADEYEVLRRQKQFKHGIILGKRDDGSIRYIRTDLAVMDALEWFSAADMPRKVQGVARGEETWKDIGMDAVKGPFEKVIKGWEPLSKTTFELVLGRSVSFPTVWREGASWKPGGMAIRDKVGYVLKNVTPLDRLWNKVTNKPERPGTMRSGLEDALLTYSVDPGEASYYLSRDIANDWGKKNLGKEEYSGAGNISEKGNALYYFKRASQWGDRERASYWFAEYLRLGGKARAIKGTIERGHPLGSIPPAKRGRFMASLNAKDKEIISDAISWYKRLNSGVKSKGSSIDGAEEKTGE